ncbi:pilus assembly protein TadG-related protein [Arthrobacter sp. GCM10027362]|uniref:pilus assembly protein TadG-related protein n=1 Tax=Arthrobacter sp. GCM10027362 TaxID=3273379 RepID=UPI003628F2C1
MRWVRKTADSERGASAVMVAFLMTALLGFAAIAVDAGAVFWEKAQLQNGADAAALAIAQDCGMGSCGNVNATAQGLINGNALDNVSGVEGVSFPSVTTVRVQTLAQDAGTGAPGLATFFARFLGEDSVTVRAAAEASWGSPSSGTSLPWTIGECVFKQSLSPAQLAELQSTGNFTGNPTPTHLLLRYDENTPDYPGCAAQNGYVSGGFGWLDMDGGTCEAQVDLAAGEAGNNPGNDFPGACEPQLATLKDQPILVPVFGTSSGSGQRATYQLTGFAAFQVTGWKFGGGPSLTSLDPAAPSCTGNCRGIQGYFTRFVSLEEGLSLGTGPNFGGSIVALTR